MHQIKDPTTFLSNRPSGTNELFASGHLYASQVDTVLYLADGTAFRVPTALLLNSPEIATALSELAPRPPDSIVVPVVEEQLTIDKRTVVTGTVHVDRNISEHRHTVDEPLVTLTYDVERVLLEVPVSAPPAIRYEGDTTVYPVTEERVITTTQLFLKEEVRVTKRISERRDVREITLMREDVSVTRLPPQG